MQHSAGILISVSSISAVVLNIVSVLKLNLRSLMKCGFYFMCQTSLQGLLFEKICNLYLSFLHLKMEAEPASEM